MNANRNRKNRVKGFTLIELIIVISIIMILSSIAIPAYTRHLVAAREAVMKEDLYSMRNAIDQYSQDKNKGPKGLDDLVTAGYLHAIPKDPITNSTETWQTVQEDVLLDPAQTDPGITDVHSGSNATALDGTAYNTW